MLPKNRLGRQMLKKLKVYAGPEHPHAAQKAKPVRDHADLPVIAVDEGSRGTSWLTPPRPTVTTTETDVEETYEADEQGVAYTSESRPVRRRPGPPGDHRPRRAPPAAARRPSPASASCPAPASGPSTAARSTRYFPNKLHQQVVNEPFATTQLEGRFDVIARIHGGGITGQAGALRLGVARCLNSIDDEANRPVAEEGRAAHPRRPRHRAQEGRSQEGPQGAAVQQALIA